MRDDRSRIGDFALGERRLPRRRARRRDPDARRAPGAGAVRHRRQPAHHDAELGAAARRASSELELLVVLDIFRNETALARALRPALHVAARARRPAVHLSADARPAVAALPAGDRARRRAPTASSATRRRSTSTSAARRGVQPLRLARSRSALLETAKRLHARRHPDEQPRRCRRSCCSRCCCARRGQGSFKRLLAPAARRARGPTHRADDFLGAARRDRRRPRAPGAAARCSRRRASSRPTSRASRRSPAGSSSSPSAPSTRTTRGRTTTRSSSAGGRDTNYLYVHPDDAARDRPRATAISPT